MNKLVRYGLLLLVVSLIGLSIFFIGAPVVLANEEEAVTNEDYTPAERAAAIEAANVAISRLPQPHQIVAYEQAFIDDVAKAFALVEIARDDYDAEDSDFDDLAKLYAAERHVFKLLAIQTARDAIDLIPPLDQITEADRETIEETGARATFSLSNDPRLIASWKPDGVIAADIHTRHKTIKAIKYEFTQCFVVCCHFSFSLKHMNFNTRLIICCS